MALGLQSLGSGVSAGRSTAQPCIQGLRCSVVQSIGFHFKYGSGAMQKHKELSNYLSHVAKSTPCNSESEAA